MSKRKSVKVYINNFNEIKEFVNIANKYPNLDLESGRYCVSASSLMGLFSLNLSEAVELTYPEEYHDEIVSDFSKWIID